MRDVVVWIFTWLFPRVLVAMISGSIISWALAAYLVSQFQSVVDTIALQLTSRMDSSENRILSLDEWSRAFSIEIQTQLQTVGKLDDRVGLMYDSQEAFFSDNQMRIAALAESTDFLISNASKMLRDYVTPEPRPLGLVSVGSNIDLTANDNGLLALYFDSATPIYPFITFNFKSLPPDSVRVSMYSQISKENAFFTEVFSAVTQPIAYGSAKVGLVPALPGMHYVLIEGSPNLDVTMDFFEVPEEK